MRIVIGVLRQFLMDRVRSCCRAWHLPFGHVLELRHTSNERTARQSARHPVLLSLGGNGLEDTAADQFIIKRYNYLKHSWRVVCTVPGYRFGHCALQAGDYLYILGGQSGKIWDEEAAFLTTVSVPLC